MAGPAIGPVIQDLLDKVPFLGRRLSDPETRRNLTNIFWLLADKFVRIGVGVFVGLWVARHLQPEGFGDLNYVLAIVGMFAGFSTLGLESIVVRDLVQAPDQQGRILGTALALQSAASAFLAAGCGAFLLLVGDDGAGTSLGGVLASATILTGGIASIRSWFQYRVLSKYVVWVENSAYLLVALLKIAFIQMDAGLDAFLFAFLLESLLAAAGVAVMRMGVGQGVGGLEFDRRIATRMLRDGLPVAISNLAILLYMKMDQVMIRSLVDTRELGLYAAAVRICEMWYFIPITVVNTLFPALIALHGTDEARFLVGVRRLIGWLVVSSVAIGVAVATLSGPIVAVLYGPHYAESARLLAIQIWSGVFISVGVASGTWIYAKNLQNTGIVRSLVGLAANLGLNLLWIPTMGAYGASLATIVSQAVANYGVSAALRSTRPLFLLQVEAPWFALREVVLKLRFRRRSREAPPPSDPGDP